MTASTERAAAAKRRFRIIIRVIAVVFAVFLLAFSNVIAYLGAIFGFGDWF